MITLILAFFITIFGVEFFLKNFFQRLRPQFTNHNQQLTISSCPTDFSFPSGHAATAFAAATVLAYFDKKRRFFY
jgi:undecaprenyl-diphosphatase